MAAPRMFPVLNSGFQLPWAFVEPHRAAAMRNHGGQTLERLAERGGLDWVELEAVVFGRPFPMGATDEAASRRAVLARFAAWRAADAPAPARDMGGRAGERAGAAGAADAAAEPSK